MRHADIATTMNVYGDSVPKQRKASSKVVQLLLTNRKAGREKQMLGRHRVRANWTFLDLRKTGILLIPKETTGAS